MWIFTLKTTLSKTETVWTGTKLACSRLSDSLTDSVEDAKVKSTLKVGGAGKRKMLVLSCRDWESQIKGIKKAGTNSRCPFYRGVRLIEVSVTGKSTVPKATI